MNDQMPDLNMDAESLYREEVITDQKIGTIRQLIPVTADGEPDPSRQVMYVGSAQMMTPAGALPLSFRLEVDTIAEAVAAFGESAKVALEHTLEEIQEMQRQAASSIVVPGQGPAGGGGLGGGGIQMP
jgi:hypothetical protein